MTLYRPRSCQLYLERKDWVLNPQPFLFLSTLRSLTLSSPCSCSLYFSHFQTSSIFSISSSTILCGFTTLMQNTYPYQVAISKKQALILSPCTLTDCVWLPYQMSYRPLLTGRWKMDRNKSYPTCLLSLFFSCLSFCFSLSLLLSSPLSYNLTDVEKTNLLMLTVFLLICVCVFLCVCVWVHRQGAPVCLCVLWPACDVWSRIHLVHLHFVCLSQPSICCWGESWVWWSCHGWPAGCCLFGWQHITTWGTT